MVEARAKEARRECYMEDTGGDQEKGRPWY